MKKTTTIVLVSGLIVSLFSPLLSAQAAISDWQKSGSIVPNSQTVFSSASFQQSVRNLQASGANTVTLIVPYYQSNNWSTDIGPGWNTPTDQSLIDATDFIHSLGMHVVYKVHLESYSYDWRANIDPSDRTNWFSKYGAVLNHLADIGKAHNVEGMVLGAELIKMASGTYNGSNTQNWVNMIHAVRSRYSGFLTYDANWGSDGFAEEVPQIKFWNELDYIGISAYYPIDGDMSVARMNADWDAWRTNRIEPIHNQYNKPILFSEVGYRSVDNANHEPWNSSAGGNYNDWLQSQLYQEMFQYWNNYSYFKGVYLWDWNPDPNYGGNGNTNYTPQHKSAENVMKQYFGSSSGGTTGGDTGGTGGTGGGGTTTGGGNGGGGTTSTGSGNWSATGSTNGTAANSPVTINTSVTTTGAGSNLNTDFEIYDQNNSQVLQKIYFGQNFTANAANNYQFNWTPTQNGSYKLKVGLFTNDWKTNYYWNDSLSTITIGSTGSTGSTTTGGNGGGGTGTTTTTGGGNPTTAVTNIWWPTDGASVSGVQPFKAMLEGWNTSSYSMYWQVDGDQLNQMADNPTDYPHKQSDVNLTGWNWKGTGPYTINFVSKDSTGKVLSQKAVQINITQ